MGNCINRASSQQQRRHAERVAPEEREEEGLDEVRRISQVLQEEDEEEEEVGETASAAGVKVKVVLTRAELEWLMAQLKSGEQRLEDVLHQMGAAAARAAVGDKPPRDSWRPRLECILEGPEAPEAAAAVDAT